MLAVGLFFITPIGMHEVDTLCFLPIGRMYFWICSLSRMKASHLGGMQQFDVCTKGLYHLRSEYISS
jgi:hypothetical protein